MKEELKELFIDCIIVIFICAIFYACFAFCMAKTNAFEWPQDIRFDYTYLVVVSSIIAILIRRALS